MTEILELAKKAAVAGGNLMEDARYNNEFTVSHKSVRELVTTIDIEVEQLIVEQLKRATPQAQFLTEEANNTINPEALHKGEWWIIDPIDGTTNYVFGHLHCAVSIAYMLDGVIHVGVIHAPFLDETYHALKNNGAYLNGKKLPKITSRPAQNSLIATGFPYARHENSNIGAFVNRLLQHFVDIRRCGAASLDCCWLAAGKLDGYLETVKPWDIAAGRLIALEAGAVASNLTNTNNIPQDINGELFTLSTEGIHQELSQIWEGNN